MNLVTINSGSSSIKAALFPVDDPSRCVGRFSLAGIGQPSGRVTEDDGAGTRVRDEAVPLPDAGSALEVLFDCLSDQSFAAIGHRIVHGGPRFHEPTWVSPDLRTELERIRSFVPLHLPPQIEAMDQFSARYPDVPQVACFDTAFHHDLPEVARVIALPERFGELRRFGFHGLSYESILGQLREIASKEASGRVIVAHLGAGASMAAVRAGVCVETTMGFTPTSGLVMATRPGDVDPGLIAYLIGEFGLSGDDLQRMFNQESGVRALSGGRSDFRELLEREATDEAARRALSVFCYHASRAIGALVVALGGLDALIFTAGVGENSSVIRERICEPLGFLGVHLDQANNQTGNAVISTPESAVCVRVMRTDEESVIARHTATRLREHEGQ